MADFAAAHAKTSKHEAGYANHPSDKGGETYRGIARKFWADWGGWKAVDQAKAILSLSPVQLALKSSTKKLDAFLAADPALERAVAEFYKREFWDVLALDAEPSQPLAEKVYDVCVNMGGKPAAGAMRAAYERIKAEVARLGLGAL